MWTYVIVAIIALFVVVCNVYTAYHYSSKEMRKSFVEGQCLVGKISANAFYSLAWALKGLRFAVLSTVK